MDDDVPNTLIEQLRDERCCNDRYLRLEAANEFERLLDAIEDVLAEREGISTSSEARLALMAHADRPFLGGKDYCDRGEQATCDECMTEAQAVEYCQHLIETAGGLGTAPPALATSS